MHDSNMIMTVASVVTLYSYLLRFQRNFDIYLSSALRTRINRPLFEENKTHVAQESLHEREKVVVLMKTTTTTMITKPGILRLKLINISKGRNPLTYTSCLRQSKLPLKIYIFRPYDVFCSNGLQKLVTALFITFILHERSYLQIFN